MSASCLADVERKHLSLEVLNMSCMSSRLLCAYWRLRSLSRRREEMIGWEEHSRLPGAAQFRRHAIFTAQNLQDCGGRRIAAYPQAQHNSVVTRFSPLRTVKIEARENIRLPPGAAQFRRHAIFTAQNFQD